LRLHFIATLNNWTLLFPVKGSTGRTVVAAGTEEAVAVVSAHGTKRLLPLLYIKYKFIFD
jgi:hypothetical protein